METETKRRRGRPATGRTDGVVRLNQGLIAQAKMVALARGTTAAQLLTELLTAPLAKAYDASVRNGPRIEIK